MTISLLNSDDIEAGVARVAAPPSILLVRSFRRRQDNHQQSAHHSRRGPTSLYRRASVKNQRSEFQNFEQWNCTGNLCL